MQGSREPRGAFAPEDPFTRRFQTILLGKTDAVLALRTERFDQ